MITYPLLVVSPEVYQKYANELDNANVTLEVTQWVPLNEIWYLADSATSPVCILLCSKDKRLGYVD